MTDKEMTQELWEKMCETLHKDSGRPDYLLIWNAEHGRALKSFLESVRG